MQQTFPTIHSISIADAIGDIKIRGCEQQMISVISDRDIAIIQQEDDIMVVHHYKGDLELAVPYEQVITAKQINGDLSAENVQQIALHEISGNISLKAIAGEVRLGHIGGNAELKGMRGLLDVGAVGGNVFVEASFPPESVTRLQADGNIHFVLPSDANLTIQATVGGMVHSPAGVSAMGNYITLAYGDGAARLEVSAGGNLELYGDQTPKSTSTFSGNWDSFTHDWQNKWKDANTEFAASFGSNFMDGFMHAAEKQQRKAEKYRQAKRPHKRANRTNIHINNQVRHMSSQQVDRIVADAYDVAAKGTQGALDAVEQALKNLHVTPPSSPPQRPKPPTRSHDVEKDVNVSHTSERPNQPPKQTGPTGNSATDLEQERLAILRMVADGQITPEEGDMLLEAL
jgi:hypothetical protein